jgi:thiol:disulfide interchange protein
MFIVRSHALRLHLLVLFVLFGSLVSSAFAQKDTSPHSDASLVAQNQSIQPGKPFTVALRIKMDPKWHSYWINPGDSGLATKINWKLPAGFKAGAIEWPHPEKISTPPLMTYGYENEVWLLTKITPPATLPEKPVALQAEAKWLICREECLPASANVALTLPVKNAPAVANAAHAATFAKVKATLPISNPAWKVRAEKSADNQKFTLRLTPPAGTNPADWAQPSLYFFADTAATLEHAVPQKVTRQGNDILIALTPSEYAEGIPKRLSGILLAPSGRGWTASGQRALAVNVPLEAAGKAIAQLPETPANSATTATTGGDNAGPPTLAFALMLAFGGGLLLNLMPCVFPVLSLKVLGFVQQAGEEKSRIKKHGFAFGAGVLLSFWVLAGALLILRASGGTAGWGYQLQSPLFVAGLIILLFAVGLNLLGAFEVGLSLTRISAPQKAGHGGYSGSFWSGVLATIVATPCTAPFMGSALAYALTQPTIIALSVFTFLGLGMAAPYVVLSLNPAWIKKLPRPGAWMETFKQLMAFPIFATVLWLFFVFGLQTGVLGMVYLMGAILFLGLGIWIIRRWDVSSLKFTPRAATYLVALSSVAIAGYTTLHAAQEVPPESTTILTKTDVAQVSWEPYSDEKVEQSLAQGRPVFIDFTAAWCITCQVNKRTALARPKVVQEFEKRNVHLLRADWTRQDAEITKALERYGRNGVPTYVLLPGKEVKPQVLPEVLSQSVILDALKNIGPRLAAETSNS